MRLLHRVPTEVSAVAVLVHLDGYDQTEVAEILAVSRRTVVYRLAAFASAARAVDQEAA